MGKKDLKVKKGGLPTIQITYAELNKRVSDWPHPDQVPPTILGWLMHKFDQSEVDNVSACRINRVVVAVRAAVKQMEVDYRRDVITPFQDRLAADGMYKKTREEVEAMTVEEQAKFMEHDKWNTEQNRLFGERVAEFNLIPLAPQHLAGIKISPAEIRALGGLFDEGGAERTKAFKAKLGIAPDAETSPEGGQEA